LSPSGESLKGGQEICIKRHTLVTLQWSQSSDIMGGYITPDSMLEIGRLMSTMK